LLPAGISARFSENFLIVLHLKIDGIDAWNLLRHES
jgi:hypothetical protein